MTWLEEAKKRADDLMHMTWVPYDGAKDLAGQIALHDAPRAYALVDHAEHVMREILADMRYDRHDTILKTWLRDLEKGPPDVAG